MIVTKVGRTTRSSFSKTLVVLGVTVWLSVQIAVERILDHNFVQLQG